jgi:hypothetical protein
MVPLPAKPALAFGKRVTTSEEVRRIVNKNSDDSQAVSFRPMLEYNFKVAGKRRRGGRVRFGSGVYSTG